jgi:hypothetical protein
MKQRQENTVLFLCTGKYSPNAAMVTGRLRAPAGGS